MPCTSAGEVLGIGTNSANRKEICYIRPFGQLVVPTTYLDASCNLDTKSETKIGQGVTASPRVYLLNSHPHSINFDPRNDGLTVVLRTATTIFLLPYSAVSYNAQRDMKDQGPYRLGFRSRREITFIQASCEA